MELQGKTFIVSGGSSGLGEATARTLSKAGAHVVIADINDEKGNALAGELGDTARYINTDVSDESKVRAAIQLAVDTFQGLNGVVNCAGIGAAMRVVSKAGPHPLDLFQAVLNVNLVGTFNFIRLGAEAIMKVEPDSEGERGVIINTASVAAFEGQIGQAAYSASKGGVVAMTLPIARELARHGIRVVTIAPGLFDTPMMAGLSAEVRASLETQVPFPPRLGRPAEYAALAKHIVENTMLNGETIRLDGAIRMQPK